MEEISTEQKLQLVQQIRNQHQSNQYDMYHRERVLYDKMPGAVAESDANTGGMEYRRFRGAIAALLFIFTIVFDLFGVQPFGYAMEEVFGVIAVDYREEVETFAAGLITVTEQEKELP